MMYYVSLDRMVQFPTKNLLLCPTAFESPPQYSHAARIYYYGISTPSSNSAREIPSPLF